MDMANDETKPVYEEPTDPEDLEETYEIETYVDKLNGLNLYNVEEEDVFIGGQLSPDAFQDELIDELTERHGEKEKQGLLILALLCRFPGLAYDREKLLNSRVDDLSFDCTKDSDGGIDGVVVDSRNHVMYPIQCKDRTSIDDARELREFLRDVKARIIRGETHTIRTKDQNWVAHLQSLHERFKKQNDPWRIEPIYITRSDISDLSVDTILKDVGIDSGDNFILLPTNLISRPDLIFKATDVRCDWKELPDLQLSFRGIIAPKSVEDGVELVMGYVSLIQLVAHFARKDVGPFLFGKNVRFSLGKTGFQDKLRRTLSDNPERFRLYHNGLTATASRTTPVKGMEDTYIFSNLFIVNGAQTLAACYEISQETDPPDLTEVLIPVKICILYDPAKKTFNDSLGSKIAVTSNTQEAIKTSDLWANYKLHRTLREKLKRYGLFYVSMRSHWKGTEKWIPKTYKERFYLRRSVSAGKKKRGRRKSRKFKGGSSLRPLKELKACIGTKKPRTRYPMSGTPNKLGRVLLGQYLMATKNLAHAARTKVEQFYESRELHNSIWITYGDIEDGHNQHVTNQDFTHILLTICAAATLQNLNLELKPAQRNRLKKLFDYNEDTLERHQRNLLWNARFYFVDTFWRKYWKGINKIIVADLMDPKEQINKFFKENGPKMKEFLSSLPGHLLDAMEYIDEFPPEIETRGGKRILDMDRQGIFFQHEVCLKKFRDECGL